MKALLPLLCAAIALLPFTGQSSKAAPVPPLTETPWFPLKKGTKWTYRANQESVVVTVKDVKKYGTMMEDAYELETTVAGTSKTEQIVLCADGLYRVQINDKKVEPPHCLLKLPVKKGESWNIDSKVGDETLKGKFTSGEGKFTFDKKEVNTVTVEGKEFLANGQKIGLTYSFAEKLGMVKMEADLGGVKVTLELTGYEPAK